jgi:hypothetical protein
MKPTLLLLAVAALLCANVSCAFNPCPPGYAPSYGVSGIGRFFGPRPELGANFNVTCVREVTPIK